MALSASLFAGFDWVVMALVAFLLLGFFAMTVCVTSFVVLWVLGYYDDAYLNDLLTARVLPEDDDETVPLDALFTEEVEGR